MCGITGYIHTDGQSVKQTGTLRQMLAVQRHRGPDDSGMVAFDLAERTSAEFAVHEDRIVEGRFTGMLGFNRLSILDLSENGHQPMYSPDRQVILTLNGEIYNAFELKPGLEADGVRFRSTTDTEVVLYLYLKYGFEEMVKKLNGMFAIVVVDLRLGKMFLTRDRFGIKPMYVFRQPGLFAFSSEIKSFLSLPGFRARLNEEALDEYLIYRNTLRTTLIRDVERIGPGQFWVWTVDGQVSKHQYFDVNEYRRVLSDRPAFDTAIDHLKEVLRHSVRSQLMSDVKLGCQLSGGIDSSLVTWLAREMKQDDLLESVSIVFENTRMSEKRYIDQVVEKLGIVSHQFPLDADYYRTQFQTATWHFEQPVNHPNTVGIFLLAQRAREHVTVLLSGEGADEVFGGYSRFYDVKYPYSGKRFYSGLLRSFPNVFAYLKKSADPFQRANINAAFISGALAATMKNGFSYERAAQSRKDIFSKLSGSPFDRQVKYDMLTYLPDLLTRQDKMSMAHSIENRVPFLDNEVVRHSFQIPEEYLIRRRAPESSNTEKYILKRLCASVFGNDFAFRDKMGFGIPLRDFMTQPDFNAYLREGVLPGIERRGILNATQVRGWLEGIDRIGHAELDALWVVTSLEIWMQQYIDKSCA
jgi:asparagine synthase (glutamine-hydrolysing)